jgi:membrane protease YdiL (CAAX protease family)
MAMDESQPIPDGIKPIEPESFWEEAREETADAANTPSSSDPVRPDLPEDRTPDFNVRLFLWLLMACVAATLGMIPFTISLLKQAQEDPFSGLPWSAVLTASAIIEIAISAGFIAIGMAAGRRFPWGVPPLCAWLAGGPEAVRRVRRSVAPALATGMALGALVAIFAGSSGADPPDATNPIIMPSAWEGLLASISAGIREEIWFRLGCMTFLAWMGTLLMRPLFPRPDEPPAPIVWIANLLAALLFAVIHLPQAKLLLGLTPAILLFVILGNGVPGMIFGWLYWRRGLIAAVVAHFGFDLVLKVFIPLLF